MIVLSILLAWALDVGRSSDRWAGVVARLMIDFSLQKESSDLASRSDSRSFANDRIFEGEH